MPTPKAALAVAVVGMGTPLLAAFRCIYNRRTPILKDENITEDDKKSSKDDSCQLILMTPLT